MEEQKFARCLQHLLDMTPSWFAMRGDTSSVGANFLNVVGLELDELASLIEYAYQQTHLTSSIINELDIAYKTSIPIHLDIKQLDYVKTERIHLTQVYTIDEFMATHYEVQDYQAMHSHDVFFVDYDKNIIYVKQPYDVLDDYPYGKLMVSIEGVESTYELTLHHIWNYLDEIGLLLGCERLEKETNERYRHRLKDVAHHPGGSNRQGLINGLSRDLNLRKTLIWQDGSQPFIINDPMVVLNSIEVDYEFVPLEQIGVTINQQVILQGDPQYAGISREVSYVYGFEMHQMHNKEDLKLQSELVNIDNTSTDLLKYYVDRINAEAPIIWDHFRWDESFWDTSKPEETGLGYLANVYDANISGFKNYR